jgi:hypothetical protein
MRDGFEKLARLWNQFYGFGFVTKTRQLKKAYPGILRIHVGFGGKTLILVGAFDSLEQIHTALADVTREFAALKQDQTS